MDLLNELSRTDIDPAMLARVRVLFDEQQAKLTRQDAVLAEKDFKVTALTHELAYYRRIRFGKANEALAGEQRLLFEETVDIDLAAIESELEAQTPAKQAHIDIGSRFHVAAVSRDQCAFESKGNPSGWSLRKC